jgi:hypothetical protein
MDNNPTTDSTCEAETKQRLELAQWTGKASVFGSYILAIALLAFEYIARTHNMAFDPPDWALALIFAPFGGGVIMLYKGAKAAMIEAQTKKISAKK